MNPPEGYITVAEAARRWGVSERTAYRRARALPASDIVTEDNRVYVRQQAAPSPTSDTAPPEVPTGDGNTSDRPSDTSEDIATVLREVITRQDAEILYLRDALQREQSIAMSATTDAQELRRRLLALAPSDKPSEGDSTAQGVDTATSTLKAQDKSPASQNEQNQASPMPWWKRVFSGGGR